MPAPRAAISRRSAHGLTALSADEHRAMGLLSGWTFFHAPRGVACSLCGDPAQYLTKSRHGERGWCLRHARDF